MAEKVSYNDRDESLKASSRISTLSASKLNSPEASLPSSSLLVEDISITEAESYSSPRKITKAEYNMICMETLNKKRKRMQVIASDIMQKNIRKKRPFDCSSSSTSINDSTEDSENYDMEHLRSFLGRDLDY